MAWSLSGDPIFPEAWHGGSRRHDPGPRPAPLMGRADAQGALGQLTDVLTGMAAFRDLPTREVIVGELDPGIRARLPLHASARQEAVAIVRACLNVPGGLTALAEVLAEFHGPGPQLERFRYFADILARGWAESALTEDERRALLRMLRGEPGRRPWLAAYLEVAGPAAGQPPDDPAEAVAVLEDLTARAGELPRVLRFTMALAEGRTASHGLRREADDWTAALSARLGFDYARPHRPPADPADLGVLLVLSLQPYLPRGGSFLVSAWLEYGTDGLLTLAQEDEPRTLDQIPPLVDGFLDVVRDYGGGRPPRRVEFLLPRTLLDLPVDRWVSGAGAGREDPRGTPLGLRCPVVVRDLERATDPPARERWARRWQVQTRRHALAEQDVLWLESGPGEERRQALRAAGERFCAVVVEPDGSGYRALPSTAESLAAALDAGVPVVLWDRAGEEPFGGPPPGTFRHTARQLMHGGAFEQLPERLRSLRAEALESADGDWGRRLALLWDDPTRTVGAGGGALRWP
ncbi:hypothetical protein AB0D49_33485 [Streptomyces sp. NPDC048290]|uniref:VMAP-C domain-containing protein n=1 Tax=Streptomyces sp. NPDC048290 TaxID=3155811 RepID=UPI00343CC2B8